jgi:hypothetical protein
MGLFDSLVNLVGDVATVVTKPVEIVTDLADAAVKPLADGLSEISKDVKDLTK